MTSNETKEQTLQRLTVAWKVAKEDEAAASRRRIDIESEIWAIVHNELPEKGTFKLDTGMKIVTGWNEEWDQEKLAETSRAWVAPVPFPFEQVFKADAKAVTYIRENVPEAYRQLQEALTLKPRKPAFSVAEPK